MQPMNQENGSYVFHEATEDDVKDDILDRMYGEGWTGRFKKHVDRIAYPRSDLRKSVAKSRNKSIKVSEMWAVTVSAFS